MHYALGAAVALTQLNLRKKTAADDSSNYRDYLPAALAAGGLALGGVGGYKLLRRQHLSDNPVLRALQQRAGDLPFHVATSHPVDATGQLIRRALYGAKDISQEVQAAGRAGRTHVSPGTVLHHGSPWDQLPVKGKVDINAPRQGLVTELADKGTFAKKFQDVEEKLREAGDPTSVIPSTVPLADMKAGVRGDYEHMRRHLKDTMAADGWIIKPTDESLGSLEGFINERTNPASERVQQAWKNPHNQILQEKLPFDSEYRVHTVNGVPFASTHRRAPEGMFRNAWNRASKAMGIGEGGFAHVPVTGDEGRALEEFVGKVNKPLHGEYAEAPIHQAFDVGRLPDGSFRLIESNPTPGTFNNPSISRKLQETVTGRMHKDKALAGAAALGLGGGAAGYGAGKGINALTEPDR